MVESDSFASSDPVSSLIISKSFDPVPSSVISGSVEDEPESIGTADDSLF